MTNLTYPVYSTACGWNAMLPPRTPTPALQGNARARYAVIGSGYTGLAVARRLAELEPESEIMVLEATTVGEGSSARNSGFTGKDVLPRGVSLERAEEARRQTKYHAEGFDWLMDQIQDHGIVCDLQRVGSIRAAATELGERGIRATVEVVRKNDIEHEVLSTDELEHRIGTRYYRIGLFLKDTYLLQPAALIRGLADSLPSNVRLHENTPVLSMHHSGKWQLRTRDGVVTADKVALTTNGFIKKFGYLKSRLVTIFTYAAVTEAMSASDAAMLGSDAAWGVLPAHRLGTTLRRIGSDRLMVRSLYGYEHETDTRDVEQALTERFNRRWPDLRHVKFEYVWGGTTALTMNGSPWWGRVDTDLYASGGCNGSGIAKGTLLGKRLAELMTGGSRHDDMIAALGTANWIAPEPFRTVGFHVVSTLEKRKAGLEM